MVRQYIVVDCSFVEWLLLVQAEVLQWDDKAQSSTSELCWCRSVFIRRVEAAIMIPFECSGALL